MVMNLLVSVKGMKFFDQLIDCDLLKKDCSLFG